MFYKPTFFLLLAFFTFRVQQASEAHIVYGFKTTGTSDPLKMYVIGDVVGVEKVSVFETNVDSSLNVDTRPDVVTVRIQHNPGIKIGQTLYLIEKDFDHKLYREGNIVGMITVQSIFHTAFFGQQLRGQGWLKMIEDKIMTVGLPIESGKPQEAMLLKKKGDFHAYRKEISLAIQNYKKSIHLDPNYPEAHAALGKIHLEGGEGYVAAGFEYMMAWKNRDKFLEDHDKFLFYLHFLRYQLYKFKTEGSKTKIKDLEFCLEIAKEAMPMAKGTPEVYIYSAEANFLMARHFAGIQNSPEARKKQDFFNEKTLGLITKAQDLRPQDPHLNSLAVFFYFDKLREIPQGVHSNLQSENVKFLRGKISDHGKAYLLFKDPKRPADKDIMSILQKLRHP